MIKFVFNYYSVVYHGIMIGALGFVYAPPVI